MGILFELLEKEMSASHEFKSEGYKLKESRDHHREGAHLTRSPAQIKAELRREWERDLVLMLSIKPLDLPMSETDCL